MPNEPVYTSGSHPKSFWQEYQIYPDRLELRTVFGTMTVPFEHIEEARVEPSDVGALLRGNLKLQGFRPALKLDWANFTEHVVVDKSSGKIHRLLFTPDDPEAFVAHLRKAMAR